LHRLSVSCSALRPDQRMRAKAGCRGRYFPYTAYGPWVGRGHTSTALCVLGAGDTPRYGTYEIRSVIT
jgi:hypothetical protein